MMTDIKYPRIVYFTGRNGYFKQSGLEIMTTTSDNVMLIPITSKGNSARCDIEIPKESIKQFITILQEALDEMDKKPSGAY